MKLNNIHHIAIICSDYQKSKHFYTSILGLTIIREAFRVERNSYKLDLALNNQYIIELFSFTDPPKRTSRPEACGLRHLAFSVNNIEEAVMELNNHNVSTEEIRIDPFTNKRFTFFQDPDQLPIEIYEA